MNEISSGNAQDTTRSPLLMSFCVCGGAWCDVGVCLCSNVCRQDWLAGGSEEGRGNKVKVSLL